MTNPSPQDVERMIERLTELKMMLFHSDAMSLKPTAPNQVETTQITTRESQILGTCLAETADMLAALSAIRLDEEGARLSLEGGDDGK